MMAGGSNTDLDVAVAGGGMVGCTVAALFARLGLQVGLVDSNKLAVWDEANHGLRVSAINPASANLFQRLDIWDRIVRRRVSPYRDMAVWENGTDARITFSARELGLPQLGHIVENSAIVSALAEKLVQNYNVRIMEDTTIEECRQESGRITLETGTNQTISCSLLVGADGVNSKIRQISGIDTRLHEYHQDAIVTSVSVEKGHQQVARQSFLPTGPVAMLPLSDGQCSIVWSSDRKYADQLMSMDDQEFGDALTAVFCHEMGQALPTGKRVRFPLRQHHAAHYISKNTALVGDAAHATHPLAGLGANIGFMDAAALAEVVEDSMQRGKEINGHSTLRRYERWRRGENALVLETMRGFKNVFGSAHGTVRSARRFGISLANEVQPLKNRFAFHAMGIQGDIPEICRSAFDPPKAP